MSAAPTANDIKSQLKTLLTTPLATGKKAKILDYMALAFKPAEGEDATVLRSSADPTTLLGGEVVKRINCLMISEEGFTQAPPQRDPTRRESQPAGRNLITRRFRLTYFYQFGELSENVFSTNVELIRTTINANPKLGFTLVGPSGTAGPAEYVLNHDGLQMPIMLPDAFGDTIVHVADGVLTVRIIEPLGT